MREIFEAFEKIENTSKKKDKQEILLSLPDQIEVKVLLNYVYNPFIMFYVVKFGDDKVVEKEQLPDFKEFCGVLETISSRLLTGNAAKDLVRNTIICKDPLYTKWMTRVLHKDLKMGMGIKSINKAYDNLIPTFELGLCETFKYTRGESVKLPTGSFYIEPKLDGFRCAVFIRDGKCEFLSRNNKPIFNTQIIEKELLELGFDNCMLDGEIMADDWNDTASIVMTEDEPHEKIDTLKFHIFDHLTLEEWDTKESIYYLQRRLRVIKQLMDKGIYDHVKLVDSVMCPNDFIEAQKIFDNFREQNYEGAILKRVSSEYPFGRSKDWIKWKEFISVEGIIKEVLIGTGKNKGRLGAFLCDYNGTDVRVGSGFTDEERDYYWENKDKMIGLFIEIKAQESTKDGSLRFPVFLRERKDMNQYA